MEAAAFKLNTKIQPDTNLMLLPSKNKHRLSSSVRETWKCYCLDIKWSPPWVALSISQKMLSLRPPRTDRLGTVLMLWGGKYQDGLCNFSLSNTKCYRVICCFSPLDVCLVAYRELSGRVCGGSLWAV